MRICFVTSSYPRFEEDGNARFVRSLAEALVGLGSEVHVVAPYTPLVRDYASPARVHWFRYVLPARWGVMGHAESLDNDQGLRARAIAQAPFFALSQALAIQRVVHCHQIDLIHAHWVLPSGFVAAWMAMRNRKPLIISLHGSDMYLARKNRILGKLAGWAFRRAHAITASSPTLAESAIELGAQSERVHVIPYGADLARFTKNEPNEIRTRLKLHADDCVILAAGRLVSKKGFAQLVLAMPLVLDAVPRARLVIVGEGPERAVIEKLMHDLQLDGKVRLTGKIAWHEMPCYLAACDIFVMPSVRDPSGNLDGLPNVILEAMAAGKPVIATRIAGIPLAVQDGETGILVDDADAESLSRGIVRLLKSRKERLLMGSAARKRVELEFNWMGLAKRFDQMYQEAGI